MLYPKHSKQTFIVEEPSMLINNIKFSAPIFNNAPIKAALSALIILFSVSAKAGVSFTNTRIFIDNNTSKQDFLLFNRGDESETCNISLVDYNVNEDGSMTPLEANEKAPNSAKPYVRFSPRRVVLGSQQTQKVKILARGYNRADDNELLSYLSIACKANTAPTGIANEPSNSQYKAATMIPTLISRVPIIIRKQQVPVDIDFSDIKLTVQGEEQFLDFNLLREGERSVYGSIKLLDESGNQLAVRNGVSSYIQTKALRKKLKFEKSDSPTFTLTFEENQQFGGTETKSITITNSLKN